LNGVTLIKSHDFPKPKNVTLLENRGFGDVIKELQMKPSWV
jgi:hypothetical protein